MRIHNNYPEKKDTFVGDLYLKALVFGIVLLLLLIGAGKILAYFLGAIINYWMWILGLGLIGIIARHYYKRKKELAYANSIR